MSTNKIQSQTKKDTLKDPKKDTTPDIKEGAKKTASTIASQAKEISTDFLISWKNETIKFIIGALTFVVGGAWKTAISGAIEHSKFKKTGPWIFAILITLFAGLFVRASTKNFYIDKIVPTLKSKKTKKPKAKKQ